MSALLFCISLLPISVVLRSTPGYMCGKGINRVHKITHLFYMDDLKIYASSKSQLECALNLVLKYTKDIGMSFGLDKCSVVHLQEGKCEDFGTDVELIDGNVIKHLGTEESYTYLGIPQRGIQNVKNIKETLCNKYKSKLRKIWSSELNGKNKVSATNMLAIPIILYSFGVVQWTRKELKTLDSKTRKVMNMNRSLHPKASVERLYLPRPQGGRGLLSLECLQDRSILDAACRLCKSSDPLLQLAHNHESVGKGAFVYQAAQRVAKSLQLELDLSGGEEEQGASDLISLSVGQRRLAVREAQLKKLLDAHVGKALHGQYYKNIDRAVYLMGGHSPFFPPLV